MATKYSSSSSKNKDFNEMFFTLVHIDHILHRMMILVVVAKYFYIEHQIFIFAKLVVAKYRSDVLYKNDVIKIPDLRQ